VLKKAGCTVVEVPADNPIERDDFLNRLPKFDAAIVMLTDKIDDQVLAAVKPGFACFANFAVGFDNFNLPAMTEAGVFGCNTPDVLSDATADLGWALLMAAARRVVEADAYCRSGEWTGWGPLQFLGTQVTGATLGIIGTGRIGQAMARRAYGFDMEVLYTSSRSGANRPELEEFFPEGRCRCVSLDELLEQSDFISLHCPLTPDTKHLLSRERLKQMKRGAIIINTARGPVIDEQAMIELLQSGHLAAAGLDVFEQEPSIPEELCKLDNVVILPHIGSASTETRDKMAAMAATSVVEALQGNVPSNCLNSEAKNNDVR
jgi:glyoxylate reductase